MKHELYIIRHGETDYNKKGIVQGRGVDSSLNSTGIQQSMLFFQQYRHLSFDQIYISSLKRTKQTVQPFIEAGLPVEALPQLDEINWGIHEGMPHGASTKDIYYNLVLEWKKGNIHNAVAGGESPVDIQVRQLKFLKLLRSRKAEKVLICSHGRAIRVLLCTILGYDLKDMHRFTHQNLSLYKLKGMGDNYEVELFNDTRHLNG